MLWFSVTANASQDCYTKIGHVTRRIEIYPTQYLCIIQNVDLKSILLL